MLPSIASVHSFVSVTCLLVSIRHCLLCANNPSSLKKEGPGTPMSMWAFEMLLAKVKTSQQSHACPYCSTQSHWVIRAIFLLNPIHKPLSKTSIIGSSKYLLSTYMTVHQCLQGEVQQQHMRQQQAVPATPTVPDRSLTPVQVRTPDWDLAMSINMLVVPCLL